MLDILLKNRRSIRVYKPGIIQRNVLMQILWAAVGKNNFKRTFPSAGACYPSELYVVVGEVEGIDVGIYKYDFEKSEIVKIKDGDFRQGLCNAALGQKAILTAQVVFVVAANYNKITKRYRRRGYRYACMEVGHIGQNISLMALSLGLGTVMIGAFRDSKVKTVLGIEEEPLYIISAGLVEELIKWS